MQKLNNAQNTKQAISTTTTLITPNVQQELLENQNLMLGLVGGLIGAMIGAGLWSLITVATGYQIGFMATGIGVLVGLGVRTLGKGVSPIFGVLGAVLSLVACLAGNYLTVTIIAARETSLSWLEILPQADLIIQAMQETTFSSIDLFFYLLAMYTGYAFSFDALEKEKGTESR